MTKERGSIVGTWSYSPRRVEQIYAWHIIVTQYILAIIIIAALGGVRRGCLNERGAKCRSKRESKENRTIQPSPLSLL